MKVLITGGGGFLGSHLGDHLLKRGDEVYALDIGKDFKVRHNLGHPLFHYVEDSVFNEDLLESLIIECDLIYHMAAVVGVEHYVANPYRVLQVNINGTQNVLKYAHRYKRKVVFSSTSEVYGRNPQIPFKEDSDRVLGSTRIDRWCYSTSKAAAEHFCFAYRQMGVPIVIVRYFNVYGPRLDKPDVGRVISIFIGQLQKDKPLTIIGNGQQTRCFTYVDDAIQATIQAGLLKEAEGEIFNIGNDRETTVQELAETMIAVSGKSVPIRYVKQEEVYGESYEDVPRRVPDVTKMHNILGVTARTPLTEGLRETIRWFFSHEF